MEIVVAVIFNFVHVFIPCACPQKKENIYKSFSEKGKENINEKPMKKKKIDKA